MDKIRRTHRGNGILCWVQDERGQHFACIYPTNDPLSAALINSKILDQETNFKSELEFRIVMLSWVVYVPGIEGAPLSIYMQVNLFSFFEIGLGRILNSFKFTIMKNLKGIVLK